MRMTTAWSQTMSQNLVLRTALFALSGAFILSAFTNFIQFSKDPLILERGCDTEPAVLSQQKHTKSEIQSFLEKALAMRFNSSTYPLPEYLSQHEINKRKREQKKLSKQNIQQKVVLDTVDVEKNVITADRIITVGNIKSALPLKLDYVIGKVKRTGQNPYGLVLVSLQTLN